MEAEFLQLVRDAKEFLFEEKRKKGYFFSETLEIAPIPLPKPKVTLRPILLPSSPPPLPKPKEEKKVAPLPSKKIEEPPVPPSNALKKIIEKACPHLKLKESIPNDHFAVLRKNAWKMRSGDLEILLLEMSGDPKQKNLLANMANALASLGKKTQLVDAAANEEQKSWELFLSLPKLSFVIAPPLEHWKAPTLQVHLRMNPTTGIAHLGAAIVLFLPPIENLLSDLQLKLKVWKWLISNLQA
jgi:hypothetical protein